MSSMNNNHDKKIIIVGGGFGGVRCALDLSRKKIAGVKITLISDKPYFEYTPALYRVVTGRSPLAACVPLGEIFKGKDVEVLQDSITQVDLRQKVLAGASGSRYSFDYLVLALGSETAYFDIPGLKELSFGLKSINEALRLRRHLHEMFEACGRAEDKEQKVCSLHFVIVGGGATGVELAGELAAYSRKLAQRHKIEPSLVTIDLIEAGPRLAAQLPQDVSEKVTERLRHLEVNIYLNRAVVKENLEQVYLKDMELKTKTVIWAAGVRPNVLYSRIEGLELDKRGRVVVDDYLRVKGFDKVFVIGDAAATQYSGLAQTALNDGRYVAEAIFRSFQGAKRLSPYRPRKPIYAVPVGPNWAAVLAGKIRFYGRLGWWMRRLADLRFFLSILPVFKAWAVFRGSKDLCEACGICVGP